jgi:hypothetical protein
MKTKKVLQILFAAVVLTFVNFSFSTTAHAGMTPKTHHAKPQTIIYLGYNDITVNGIVTEFDFYGDTSTGDISQIYDATDGVYATNVGNWPYYTSPAYGCKKVEFDITISGTRWFEVSGGNFIQ